MSNLGMLLADLLIEIASNRHAAASTRAQIVFVGPPIKWLREALISIEGHYVGNSDTPEGLLYALVDNKERGWKNPVNGVQFIVTNWDFVVTLRDPERRLIVLCDPDQWSAALASIENSSELLGSARISDPDGFRQLWLAAQTKLALLADMGESEAISLLESIVASSERLENDEWGWGALDRLLGANDRVEAYRSVGLPKPTRQVESSEFGRKVMDKLASFCVQNGFDAALNLIVESGDLGKRLEPHVKSMFEFLRAQLGSSAEFDRQKLLPPISDRLPHWWNELDQATLSNLMDAVRPSDSIESMSVKVDQLAFQPVRSEPFVVRGEPSFQVSSASGDEILDLSATRRITFAPPIVQISPVEDKITDSELPDSHGRLAKYAIRGTAHKDLKFDVIPLNTFSTRCYARVDSADANRPPSMPKKGESVTQQISVSTVGPHILDVYTADGVSHVNLAIRSPSSSSVSSLEPLESNSPGKFRFRIDEVDTAADYEITTHSADHGEKNGEPLTVEFSVEEQGGDKPTTRFGALIQAHESQRNSPTAPSFGQSIPTVLSRAYLAQEGSWRGISACLRENQPLVIDWSADGPIGGIPVTEDRRPDIGKSQPPPAVLDARNKVRQLIEADTGRVEDTDLTTPEIQDAVATYASEYLKWFEDAPQYASWMDCIAIFSPVASTSISDSLRPSVNPHAVLMSPLHPARLSWHVNAQRLLVEQLKISPTPSSALIDPHASPAVISMPLFDWGAVASWLPFKSVRSAHVHWQVFVNPAVNDDALTDVQKQLQQLQFSPGSVSGSFSRTQAQRALVDASEQLSARSNLSVGLVGQPQSSSMLEQGILDWISSDEEDGETSIHDSAIVIDKRIGATTPTLEQLGHAAEKSKIGLKWFNSNGKVSSRSERIDIVLINELSIALQHIGSSEYEDFRSAVTPGALTRRDVRVDKEPRVFGSVTSNAPSSSSNIADIAGKVNTALEQSAAVRGYDAYIVRPSDDVERLFKSMRSNFVGVTSTAVDAGSFMRLAKRIGKVLWDFELPVPQNAGVEAVGLGGYYLLAQPDEVLEQRLKMGCLGVGVDRDDEPTISASLLDDIQELGIPVLRKIGRSPTSSRGEIGLVLAFRSLQTSLSSQGTSRLPLVDNKSIRNLIIPVDSYWPVTRLFKRGGRKESDSHPDLLLLRIDSSRPEKLEITCVPIEVKFRSSPMSLQQVASAVSQSANLAKILKSAWNGANSELPMLMGRQLLSTFVDHGFRLAKGVDDQKSWQANHQDHLIKIMNGNFNIDVVSPGIALVFDSSGVTTAVDSEYETDTRHYDAIKFSQEDIRALLEGSSLSGEAELSFQRLLSRIIDNESIPEYETSPQPSKEKQSSSEDSDNPDKPATDISTKKPIPTEEIENGKADGKVRQGSEKQHKRSRNSDDSREHPKKTRTKPVDEAFAGFVGNKFAIDRITLDLKRALMNDPPSLPRNYLLTGMPSTGKTELAKRISTALTLPFIRLDGRGLTSRERLFEMVDGELNDQDQLPESSGTQAGLPVFDYPPMTIFIDEIHLASRMVQESLLTTLEADDRTVTLTGKVALVGNTTFIFATTRTSGIDAAFKSRCTEIELEEYTVEEVARILQLRHSHDWPKEVFLDLAAWGRAVPRVALSLAVELETSEEVANYENDGLYDIRELAENVRRMNRVDENGMTRMHYEYLNVLAVTGKPMGEKSIASLMSTVDALRIEEEVEPYLADPKRAFVNRTPSGRQITAKGRSYLEENSISD